MGYYCTRHGYALGQRLYCQPFADFRFFLAAYLAVFAGILIYIGASDLLPEAHSKEKAFRVLLIMEAVRFLAQLLLI